jgi:hypothetical protein
MGRSRVSSVQKKRKGIFERIFFWTFKLRKNKKEIEMDGAGGELISATQEQQQQQQQQQQDNLISNNNDNINVITKPIKSKFQYGTAGFRMKWVVEREKGSEGSLLQRIILILHNFI